MQKNISISDMTLDKILSVFPQAAQHLSSLGLACVGCPMAPFETPRDAAQAYDIPLKKIIAPFENSKTRSKK